MQKENQNLFSWKASEGGVPGRRERSIVIVYVQPLFCSGHHSKYLIYILSLHNNPVAFVLLLILVFR